MEYLSAWEKSAREEIMVLVKSRSMNKMMATTARVSKIMLLGSKLHIRT